MSNKLAILVILVVFGFSQVFGRYETCDEETLGEVTDVQVTGCDMSKKFCPLVRNTTATLTITFVPSVDSDELGALVHGVLAGIPIKFDLPNPNGCKDCNVKCPIKAGATVSYVASLPILEMYPKVTVDIKWQLQNKENKDLICVRIPSKIVDQK